MALNFMLDDLNAQMRKAQEAQLAKEQAQEEQKQAQIRARQTQNENTSFNASNKQNSNNAPDNKAKSDELQQNNTPAKKIDFTANTLEQTRENNDIKQALENLDKQELLNSEKEKLNKQYLKELEELEKKYNLSSNIQNLNNVLDNKTKSDELIQEEVDFIQKVDSPAKKIDFTAHTLEQTRKNPNIKEALEILDKQELLSDEKEKLNEQHKQNLENLDKKYNKNADTKEKPEQSEQNTLKDEATQNTLDEKYLQELEALNNIHKARLEKIENERLEHEMKFQKAIDNLSNADSAADILINLKNLDKALSLIVNSAFDERNERALQREEKLNVAFKNGEVKEVITSFVKELHNKEKETKKGYQIMQKSKEFYVDLSKANEIQEKSPANKDNFNKIQTLYSDLHKKGNEELLKYFKNNYPKTYKQAQETLNLEKDKTQEKSSSQGLTR